ncbi:MAG TPA: PKD domain-containing protein, partial [Segetibacter sp.]
MKKLFVSIIILLCVVQGFANHIAGGELFYEYLGPGNMPGTSKYKITMRLFRDCQPADPTAAKLETEQVIIGIYNNSTGNRYERLALPLDGIREIAYHPESIPCLVDAPPVCFQVGLFTNTIDLPGTESGYTLTWIRCCRAAPLTNIAITTSIGATIATKIPGTIALPTGNNSSPQFALKDTALVCQNKLFELDFGATDSDGDALSYSFCEAFAGGSSTNSNPGAEQGGPPNSLSLAELPYRLNFPGDSPLGAGVSIDPATGKITGKAPAAGRYVINVCITETRNGKVINEHRKDFILEVGRCDFAAAEPLPVAGAWCKDFAVNFSNNNNSSTITGYTWDFGDPNRTDDVSTLANPTFTYSDTGIYNIKLMVTGKAGCKDSAFTTVGVYPGFTPNFETIGSCFQTPFQFTDKSIANYGTIDSWRWDFGDPQTQTDVANLKNTSYKYGSAQLYNAKLVVTSSKGCIDSITKPVMVTNKPLLTLPFKDTLICGRDTLSLSSTGNGTFTWKPAVNIINQNSSSPLVFPNDTTTYVVTLTDPSGCVNSDSLKINVLDSVFVRAGSDTIICKTDSVVLQTVSNALSWNWTPATGLIGASDIRNPLASPNQTTTYEVTARVSKCVVRDQITIGVVPYPIANAGTDVLICTGDETQLGA